jgi:hypothetical protein
MNEFLLHWKEIVLGILVPTIANVIILYRYVKKCQRVQKLIDVNTMMEVLKPFLEEIDHRIQILATSSATIAESQKILANEAGLIHVITNQLLDASQETLNQVKKLENTNEDREA